MAYDALKKNARQYLAVLNAAAKKGETNVDNAIRVLLERGDVPCAENVERLLLCEKEVPAATEVEIAGVDLQVYDSLLSQEVACGGN